MRVFFKPIKKKKARKGVAIRMRLFVLLPLLKKLVPVVIFLLAAWGIFIFAKTMLYSSDVFRISNIELHGENLPQQAEELRFYGLSNATSIFEIDAKAVSRYIMENNREFNKVIITKKLPNTLYVEISYYEPIILVRRPTGYWHDRRAEVEYFPVSKSGVILPKVLVHDRQLPILLGLDLYNRDLTAGDRIRSPQLYTALSLLEAVKKEWPSDRLPIKGFDASDTKKISVVVSANVRIIIGGKEMLDEKVSKLNRLLAKKDLKLDEIRYIDLRFDKIVIGPR